MSTDTWGGGSTAMNAFEALMWRAEPASTLRSTCLGLELLDGTPDWDDVLAVHERATRMVPRLRHRVVEAPLGLAPPRWAEDPNFDLHYHVRRIGLPDGAGWREVLAAAEQIAMSGFDRARPPWEAFLIEGFPDGRSAYVFKLHHSISDGLGILRMMTYLHLPVGMAPDYPFAEAPAAMSPLGVVTADLRERVRSAPALAVRASALAAKALRAPVPAALSGVAYGASLKRVFTPPAATPSPLLAERSSNWRFGALDVDFDSLRRGAKAVGGSLNDAYLSALLGGYRRYHQAMGVPVGPIPVAIPISLRSAEDAGKGGNEIASARLAGPVDVADPAERMAILGEQVRSAREEPAMNNLNLIGPALAKLPASAIATVIGNLTKANDLQASNVPGPREDIHLAGVRVDRLYGYGPLPGCPAMITMVTHGQIACVGVNYDAAAFTAGDLFLDSLCAGFDEVLALGGPDFPATTRR
ncbi:MAG: wax ester/triacylglycerol synthase domain-containing protein [Sporichthyaceae bacterium]